VALPSWAVHFPFEEIHEAAATFGVDPSLVAAIVQTESAGNPLVLRAEPDFAYLKTPARFAERLGISKETEIACQKISWGLMQIMGGTARDLGFEGHLTELIFPASNLYWGCKYLGTRVKKYKSLATAIAAYNSGTPVMVPGTMTFKNQKYVDKVLSFFEELK